MKKYVLFIAALLVLASCYQLFEPPSKNPESATQPQVPMASILQQDQWVTAYFAAWKHYALPTSNWGNITTDEIDWDAFTHMIYFATGAAPDGTLDPPVGDYQIFSESRFNQIIPAAHNHGVPILFAVGGWGNYNGFSQAITPGVRGTFIDNLIDLMTTWGFDGIDIDMEPIRSSDADNFTAFITELHNRMQSLKTPLLSQPLLTAAVGWQPDLFAQLQDKFDQINIMTYDYSGAWEGWVTWYNSAVSDGGFVFPSTGQPVPSVDGSVQRFTAAGVNPAKLGIGIDFYGYVWSGVSEPREGWTTPPTVEDNVPYSDIMKNYFQPEYYHWDEAAQAAYLSIQEPGNEQFISYDDEHTIHAKFDYTRKHALGGTFIYELGGGYQEDLPAGERDQLLQVVKAELNNSGTPPSSPGDTIQPTVTITSPPDDATVSDIISLVTEASDDHGIANVEFFCDGDSLGDPITKAPYTMEYNSNQLSDGSHVIIATATDVNGNQGTSSISVTVDNSPEKSPLFPNKLLIYKDNLASNWINSSWNSAVDFSNSDLVYLGDFAIKVRQQPWGALSLHSGTWEHPERIDPEQYDSLQFAIYVAGSNGELAVLAEDTKTSFPNVPYGTVPANAWTWVSIPLNKISPQGIPFDRIDITETSGSAITYYIDHVRLSVEGSSGEIPQPPSTPKLLSPVNSAGNISLTPSFDWQNCPNASRYKLQIAKDGSFNSLVVSRTITQDDLILSASLMPYTEYYWRVRSVNDVSTSVWSSIWSFTTLAPPAPVFDEKLRDPWINASWNAKIDFSNIDHRYRGEKSIEVLQNGWGALSLHYGNWGNSKDLTGYSAVEFKVYTENPEISLRIMLENDSGDSFAAVERTGIAGNQWIDVSVNLDELNPFGHVANRIDISESGSPGTTYYIDDIYLK